MTKQERNTKLSVAEAVAGDRDLIKALMKALQEVLEGEMTEFLGAEPGERTEARSGYRAGYYGRLVTRIGKLELRVPQDQRRIFGNLTGVTLAAGAVGGAGRDVRAASNRSERITESSVAGQFDQCDQQGIGYGIRRGFANRPLRWAYPDSRCAL